MERAEVIEHPFQVVGRERYERVAASVAVEPRDPFLDRRVVALCLTLPGNQTLQGGWPKVVLRHAMADHLPDAVRWRNGKEHLGWSFTTALMDLMRDRLRCYVEGGWDIISSYTDVGAVRRSCESYFERGDSAQAHNVYDAAHLCTWVGQHTSRPRALI
jgi:asparagine synthase (glutamine-hydrolysing)